MKAAALILILVVSATLMGHLFEAVDTALYRPPTHDLSRAYRFYDLGDTLMVSVHEITHLQVRHPERVLRLGDWRGTVADMERARFQPSPALCGRFYDLLLKSEPHTRHAVMEHVFREKPLPPNLGWYWL